MQYKKYTPLPTVVSSKDVDNYVYKLCRFWLGEFASYDSVDSLHALKPIQSLNFSARKSAARFFGEAEDSVIPRCLLFAHGTHSTTSAYTLKGSRGDSFCTQKTSSGRPLRLFVFVNFPSLLEDLFDLEPAEDYTSLLGSVPPSLRMREPRTCFARM